MPDLNGQNGTGLLHQKIQLALFFAVEVIQIKAVGFQFLRDGVLVYGAEVDILLSIQNLDLNAVHVHGCQQPDVGEKQLEQIGGLGKQQRNGRLVGTESRQGNAGVTEPQEAVTVPREFEILIQILQNKALVLAVQLAGNQVENISQIQLFVRIVAGNIIDSDCDKWEEESKSRKKDPARQIIFDEQELMNDIEGLPFLVTLNTDTYRKVMGMVDEYCAPRGLEYFDIAPYERENGLATTDAGALLYLNLKRYIRAPYYRHNICISFNVGKERIYEGLLADPFEYENSKYKNRTKAVLSELKVGDVVDAKYFMGEEVSDGEVVDIKEFSISIAVQVDGVSRTRIDPIDNVIYIRKRKQKT